MVRLFSIQDWCRMAPLCHYDARELAKLCQFSLRQLERDFHDRVGYPPQRWLNEQRLNAAGRLLLAGRPVKAVALDLGFKQVSHFCRQFKSYHDLTPTQFYQNHAVRTSCRSEITDVAGG